MENSETRKISVSLPGRTLAYAERVAAGNLLSGDGPKTVSAVINAGLIALSEIDQGLWIRHEPAGAAPISEGRRALPADLAAQLSLLLPALQSAIAAMHEGVDRERRHLAMVAEFADICAETWGRLSAHGDAVPPVTDGPGRPP
jgi:hypothetical protein